MDRPDSKEHPRDPGALQPPGEDALDLVRAIQADARKKAEQARAPHQRKAPSKIWPWVLVVVALANAYLWIGRPAWLTGRSETTVEEALRFRMYLQAQRIHAYQEENGVAPDRSDQAGATVEGVEYLKTGPTTWELAAQLRGETVRLPSTLPLVEFYGGGDR